MRGASVRVSLAVAAWCAVSGVFAGSARASEVTVLFSGETHAMLYHCGCPVEPDGGVARRATLVKQVRKANPGALLVDSGGFFAGGPLDEYSQDVPVDSRRTQAQIDAMKVMGYDAVALGDEEFGFGKAFLLRQVKESGIPFVSCNAAVPGAFGYRIKEVSGVKVALIGVSPALSFERSQGIAVGDPREALAPVLKKVREDGAQVVILLSHQGAAADRALARDLPGIDIVVTGHQPEKSEAVEKEGPTYIVHPSWQGRKLGKMRFSVASGSVKDFVLENIRLSDTIADDPEVTAVVPACFSGTTCKKQGFTATCENPGTMQAKCAFTKLPEVPLTVVTARDCRTCNTKGMVQALTRYFPGVQAREIQYPDKEAAELVQSLSIDALPAYIIGKEAAAEKGFASLEPSVYKKGGAYVLKPEFAGVSYYVRRPRVPGRFDVFLSIFSKDAPALLDRIKEFTPSLHFLANEDQGTFSAPGGVPEVEESLRSVCVMKEYPERAWGYIRCRASDSQSSWWEECAQGMDTARIKECARSQEGQQLLRGNTALNRELQVMTGPTYLMDNQQIFSSKGVPSREEITALRNKDK